MAIDAMAFRKVLGQFATGVTVITTVFEGLAQGLTVNSFTSVSLDPPLVLFCADKRSRSGMSVGLAGFFAVNVLGEDQRALSDLFAGKGTDQERADMLQAVGTLQSTGAPVLPNSLGWLDCKVTQTIDAGDHVIYLGEVVAASAGATASPLLYYRGSYQHLDEAWVWRDRASAREKATAFEAMVDFFDRMQNEGTYAALLDDVVALAEPIASDAACLDIGCGAGRLLRDLAPRAGSVVGVDAFAAMLTRARERAEQLGLGNVSFVEASASKLPFPDESFDRIVLANLLFYLPDPVMALREAARLLRPSGTIVLLEPSTRLTRPRVEALAAARGLRYFAAQSLFAWCDAAELGRRYDETRFHNELAEAGLSARKLEERLDGMVLLAVVEKAIPPAS